jgi:hypothetical protein
VENSGGTYLFRDLHRWEVDIKTDLTEIKHEDVNETKLTQD